jgi:hypothetical protein
LEPDDRENGAPYRHAALIPGDRQLIARNLLRLTSAFVNKGSGLNLLFSMFGFENLRPRRRVLIFCVGIGWVAAFAAAADTVADAVFAKVRARIASDVEDSRGVACMESVERTRYAPRKPDRNATCGDLIAATAEAPRGIPEWRSRVRLDVVAGGAAEEFALTEPGRFERDDVAGLLRTSAGSGEFSTFLRNIIGGEGDPFQPQGTQQTPMGRLLVFGFAVPREKSHFKYESPGASDAAPYRGSLYATPESGDLKRLTIVAENAGQACRVQYTTDYTNTRVGERDVLLPQSSTMEAINRNGSELRSETYFSGCRRPPLGPAAPATAASKPLPANVRLRVRFDPPIDTQTAASGDPVIGVIRGTVKDKQNGIIVHAGDRLHGRITAIEEYMGPRPRWNLAIAFETIERGVGEHGIDQGVEQPVFLVPLDDGDRTPHDETAGPVDLQGLRPRGGGYFIFHGPNVVLDQKFETEWETR